MAGKLIVLEGVDGAGKGTQTKLLVRALKARGRVSFFNFPRYTDSVFGQLVGQALAGQRGNFMALDPYFSSLPYMLDRASAKTKLLAALGRGHVVCNRYTTSNLIHQAAKLPLDERKSLIRFIETAEYGELGLPRPDLVIFLDVAVNVAQKLAAKKEQRSYIPKGMRDVAESDEGHMVSAADFYRLYAQRPSAFWLIECANYLARRKSAATCWEVINCGNASGILPVKTIHELIMAKVLAVLGYKKRR